MVAACANVVIAITAVVAAWYALRQYRYAVQIQDLNQVLTMYQAFRDLSQNATDQPLSEKIAAEALELLEVHERLLAEKLLSKHATNFYRDVVSIHDTFSDMPPKQLAIVRKILTEDVRGYRHLITTFKSDDRTKYIVNW
jgi:hypothetical protein